MRDYANLDSRTALLALVRDGQAESQRKNHGLFPWFPEQRNQGPLTHLGVAGGDPRSIWLTYIHHGAHWLRDEMRPFRGMR